MSFQKVKPTKPELDILKKRLKFTVRGKDLLKLKREQLINRLKIVSKNYFILRSQMKILFMENAKLRDYAYQSIGKRTLKRISTLHTATHNPSVEILYKHDLGLDVPEITLHLPEMTLPSYSFSKTSLYVDILMKKLQSMIGVLVKLAEVDKTMYQLSHDYKTVQRRIDALDDILIPKLRKQIYLIEDILADETREEFIRMKKIKQYLEEKEIN
jgi:V/A-type H+-transporting ATPase subunit D